MSTTGRVSKTRQDDDEAPRRSVLDLIHATTGSDLRTKRATVLLWHVTGAACLMVFVVAGALAIAPSIAPFALPGLGTIGLGSGGYLAYRRWRKGRPAT
jgi:hypothetical protein